MVQDLDKIAPRLPHFCVRGWRERKGREREPTYRGTAIGPAPTNRQCLRWMARHQKNRGRACAARRARCEMTLGSRRYLVRDGAGSPGRSRKVSSRPPPPVRPLSNCIPHSRQPMKPDNIVRSCIGYLRPAGRDRPGLSESCGPSGKKQLHTAAPRRPATLLAPLGNHWILEVSWVSSQLDDYNHNIRHLRQPRCISGRDKAWQPWQHPRVTGLTSLSRGVTRTLEVSPLNQSAL